MKCCLVQIQTYRKHIPIVILFLLELLLFFTNYSPNTYLLGWDNVVPEFNFKANFYRSIFGAWQEHRGLGLHDGMSHAANLFHTAFIWILSPVFPKNMLRYIFTSLMHLVGGIGVYLYISELLNKKDNNTVVPGLIGAFLYMLNIGTIQLFYVPLEAFSVHFAFLPLIGYSLQRYLSSQDRHSLFVFLVISLLSTPQYFIPTIILPVGILIGATAISSLFQNAKKHRKAVFIALTSFFMINTFWLFPFISGLKINAPIVKNAKINLMSSGDAFLRNKAFGDIQNVLTFHGFYLDFEDALSPDGRTFSVWNNHLATPLAKSTALVLAMATLVGLSLVYIQRKRNLTPVMLTFSISVLFLANNTFGIREITLLLRNNFPIVGEALRFPFTKFVLILAMSSSILIGYFIQAVQIKMSNKVLKTIITLFIMISIAFLSYPTIKGNFYFNRNRVSLPSEYDELFLYQQNNLDQNARIAIFPQPDYWSWKQYRYDYVGSGFLWYGLPQALLDIAFNPWSNYNENYHWEITSALYGKDEGKLLETLQKYNITYVLIDKNQITHAHNKALFLFETQEMLDNLPQIQETKRFENLILYERTDVTSNSYISTLDNPTYVSPSYLWTDSDVGFHDLGNYISNASHVLEKGTYYPFRSLFTKRDLSQYSFDVRESDESLVIQVENLFKNMSQSSIPDNLEFITHKLTDTDPHATLSASLFQNNEIFSLTINKAQSLVYDSMADPYFSASNTKECGVHRSGESQADTDEKSTNKSLMLYSINDRLCLSYDIPRIYHSDGHIVAIENKHVQGKPLRIAFISYTARHNELEIDLPINTDWTTSYIVLPPLAEDGRGYTIYVENDSIGNAPTRNEIRSIRMYTIPYKKLTSLSIDIEQDSSSINRDSRLTANQVSEVHHPNPSYYLVQLTENESDKQVLYLSQSYHSGWKAYTIPKSSWLSRNLPFIFGEKIVNRVVINNWANGWILPDDIEQAQEEIVLYYMPQLLQFAGFLLLICPFLLLLFIKSKRHATMNA